MSKWKTNLKQIIKLFKRQSKKYQQCIDRLTLELAVCWKELFVLHRICEKLILEISYLFMGNGKSGFVRETKGVVYS